MGPRENATNKDRATSRAAHIFEAARNTRLSKTSDNGSGYWADGNLLVESSIYDEFLARLQLEGGYLVSDEEKRLLHQALWDEEGHRTANTIARPAPVIAGIAGFPIPEGKSFLIVKESQIGKSRLLLLLRLRSTRSATSSGMRLAISSALLLRCYGGPSRGGLRPLLISPVRRDPPELIE